MLLRLMDDKLQCPCWPSQNCMCPLHSATLRLANGTVMKSPGISRWVCMAGVCSREEERSGSAAGEAEGRFRADTAAPPPLIPCQLSGDWTPQGSWRKATPLVSPGCGSRVSALSSHANLNCLAGKCWQLRLVNESATWPAPMLQMSKVLFSLGQKLHRVCWP